MNTSITAFRGVVLPRKSDFYKVIIKNIIYTFYTDITINTNVDRWRPCVALTFQLKSYRLIKRNCKCKRLWYSPDSVLLYKHIVSVSTL